MGPVIVVTELYKYIPDNNNMMFIPELQFYPLSSHIVLHKKESSKAFHSHLDFASLYPNCHPYNLQRNHYKLLFLTGPIKVIKQITH